MACKPLHQGEQTLLPGTTAKNLHRLSLPVKHCTRDVCCESVRCTCCCWRIIIALPIFFFIACLLFFCIYCQHELVNQKSLPVVLKQPVFDQSRQSSANEFYEVTVTELDGVALQNYQAGIGFVTLSQEKIKFQAFNETAIRRMSDAKGQSRLMLILFLMAVVYNCYFMAAYSKT